MSDVACENGACTSSWSDRRPAAWRPPSSRVTDGSGRRAISAWKTCPASCAIARTTGRAGCGTTPAAGTRSSCGPGCASHAAWTSGSAMRSSASRRSPRASDLALAPPGPWDGPVLAHDDAGTPARAALFDLEDQVDEASDSGGIAGAAAGAAPITELRAQLDAVAGSSDPRRLRLLLAAESAGALIAAEMRHAGLPYSAERHEELLTALLGPRPRFGRPAVLEALLAEVRARAPEPGTQSRQPARAAPGPPAGGDHGHERPVRGSSRRSSIRRSRRSSSTRSCRGCLTANGWSWLDTLGPRRPVPPRLRSGRRGDRTMGDPGRRCAPAASPGAGSGRRRPGLEAGRRRRGAAGAAHPHRAVRR